MDIKLKYRAWVGEKHADIASPLTNSDIETFAIEFAEWLVKNCTMSDVSTFLKCGWIDAFDDSVIECTLRKDYELDEELTFGRGLLTDKQNEMVCTGLVVRYNKQSNSIQFLLEDGVNWC